MLAFRRSYQFLGAALLVAPTLIAKERPTPPDVVALSINQYTSLALKNSLRIRTAEESLESNRYQWVATHRGLTWPSLTASGSESKRASDSDLGTIAETRTTEGNLTLSQPFLSGGNLSLGGTWSRITSETDTLGIITPSRTSYSPVWQAEARQPVFLFKRNSSLRARRSADLNWDNNQDSYWRERLRIEFDARKLYYDLLLQIETSEVERKKLDSAKLVNETTRALVRAGKLAEVELVRADIRSRKDERTIQNSENALEQRMNDAKDLISLSKEQAIKLTSPLTYEPFTIPLAALLKMATENNPDIQISRRSVELAKLSLQQTREGDRPDLTASGSYSLTRDRSNSALPADPTAWTISMGVEWPLFDATQTRLQTKRGQIDFENAQRTYDNEVRQVHVSIKNTYLDIRRAEEQILDFGPQKESAERNVRAIRLQYRNGLTRLTDVFDAENQMRELDLEYLGLLITFNTARDLMKVLVGRDPTESAKRKKQ